MHPPQARSGRCGQMGNAAAFLDLSCWSASPCDFLEVLYSGKQFVIRFQLALVWSTILSFPPSIGRK